MFECISSAPSKIKSYSTFSKVFFKTPSLRLQIQCTESKFTSIAFMGKSVLVFTAIIVVTLTLPFFGLNNPHLESMAVLNWLVLLSWHWEYFHLPPEGNHARAKCFFYWAEHSATHEKLMFRAALIAHLPTLVCWLNISSKYCSPCAPWKHKKYMEKFTHWSNELNLSSFEKI